MSAYIAVRVAVALVGVPSAPVASLTVGECHAGIALAAEPAGAGDRGPTGARGLHGGVGLPGFGAARHWMELQRLRRMWMRLDEVVKAGWCRKLAVA